MNYKCSVYACIARHTAVRCKRSPRRACLTFLVLYFLLHYPMLCGADEQINRTHEEVDPQKFPKIVSSASKLQYSVCSVCSFFFDCFRDAREQLEGSKIRGLTFRLMPESVLALTLSFGSKDDQFLNVCKDWLDAVLGGPARTHVGSGSERDEQV